MESAFLEQVVTALQQTGIVVVRDAFPQPGMAVEAGRYAALAKPLRVIHREHAKRLPPRSAPMQISGLHGLVQVDRTSVIISGMHFASRVRDGISSLLMSVLREMLKQSGYAGAAPERRETIELFANYYVTPENGHYVRAHIDKSFLTALTCAVSLAEPGRGPIGGFEFASNGLSTFVELVPDSLNDIILMCGNQAAKPQFGGFAWPQVMHRVSATNGDDSRFTFVFKVHL